MNSWPDLNRFEYNWVSDTELHIPVMLTEVLSYLVAPGEGLCGCHLGDGGHTGNLSLPGEVVTRSESVGQGLVAGAMREC